ncbi:alpha/beta-type small acid-soluble spore protein [Bacillus cereus]|uniref:Spore protein n=1 Tax=Bacillus cereus TaxID=1396 RepID=A0A2A8R8H3_BACCE|nr:alpha/beta-type small acid-soluble spore protein [Bacillus cereus]PEX87789.1 spore protein [Bacillus cereus]PFN19992.1 spore protein [Bacillus cereus]
MAKHERKKQYHSCFCENAIDQMKYEIAQEFGVQLGPDTTSRANGSVGGEITKRLVGITTIHAQQLKKAEQSQMS